MGPAKLILLQYLLRNGWINGKVANLLYNLLPFTTVNEA